MKNHTQNVAEKLVPDSFIKNPNYASGSTNWNVIKFVFIAFTSRDVGNILNIDLGKYI